MIGTERQSGRSQSGGEYAVLSRGRDRTADDLLEDEVETDGVGSWTDLAVRTAGRAALSIAPQFEAQLQVARELYAHAYVRAVQKKYNALHRAAIDPYRIRYVDPAEIDRVAAAVSASRFRRIGAVADGDWDRLDLRFGDTDVYRAFEARFRDGADWEDTPFFQRIVDDIDAGAEPWGCTSRSAFERRCEQLDELFESIRENGFKTQRELTAAEGSDPFGIRRPTVYSRIINDEIGVAIGRNGELLFSDGRNRLSIAKVLGVDSVPVIVLRRHADWVRFRDAVAAHVERTGDLPVGLDGHPDLTPIVERRG